MIEFLPFLIFLYDISLRRIHPGEILLIECAYDCMFENFCILIVCILIRERIKCRIIRHNYLSCFRHSSCNHVILHHRPHQQQNPKDIRHNFHFPYPFQIIKYLFPIYLNPTGKLIFLPPFELTNVCGVNCDYTYLFIKCLSQCAFVIMFLSTKRVPHIQKKAD